MEIRKTYFTFKDSDTKTLSHFRLVLKELKTQYSVRGLEHECWFRSAQTLVRELCVLPRTVDVPVMMPMQEAPPEADNPPPNAPIPSIAEPIWPAPRPIERVQLLVGVWNFGDHILSWSCRITRLKQTRSRAQCCYLISRICFGAPVLQTSQVALESICVDGIARQVRTTACFQGS